MLRKLRITNLALLENDEIEFGAGLSVLTGETGGGKSVVVTALALLLGARAEREFIRHGADQTIIQGEFSAELFPPATVQQHGLKKDQPLIVERAFSRDGSGRVKINGAKGTVTELRNLSAGIGEILGQHASQALLDETNHLAFLDRFGDLTSLCDQVGLAYRAWRKVADELARTTRRKEQLKAERELLLFQQKEISSATIQPGQELELTQVIKKLNGARQLLSSAQMVKEAINDDEAGISGKIALLHQEFERMRQMDESLGEQVQLVNELAYQLEELSRFTERYGTSIEDDPQRIVEINERLDELYNLKQKYGGSEEAILEFLSKTEQRLKELPDVDQLLESIRKETETLFEKYVGHAVKLSKKRKEAAKKLKKAVVGELKALAIQNGDFEFELIYEEEKSGAELNGTRVKPNEHGLENGRIMFTANPGEPLKPLVKTASGGEISRLLLALKSAEAAQGNGSGGLLVFDEVDVGIGGQTGTEVGKKLKALSVNNQLLVVTHLHQIARFADHHYVADKTEETDGRTRIMVQKLDSGAIVKELDRMVALPD
ncbi:MAG: DNA repair protein RecN [bacterium]|nr:DNA repair protein RecN [bacterium]